MAISNDDSDGLKPVLLMLAAHEPNDDPRVDWVAATASRTHRVTVIGIHNWNSARPDKEIMSTGYTVLRCRRQFGTRSFLIDLGRVVVRPLLSRQRALLIALSPLALLALPMEVVLRLIRVLWPRLCMRVLKAGLARMFLTRRESVLARLNIFRWTLAHVDQVTATFLQNASGVAKPAVIYCNDLDTLVAGVLLRQSTGAKLVFDSHEYWPYSNVEAPWYHVAFFRWLEGLLIKRADFAITVSDPLARELERAYRYQPVHVVPNAEPWVERSAAMSREGLLTKLARGRVSFLFQGNFAPQRGLEELVAAWSGVDGDRAALFLRGPNNQWKEAIEEKVRATGQLNTSIYLLPPVAVEELVEAAGEADVGIIPYKTESPAYKFACPNKLSQYMQAGMAVLSNNIPYVAQHLEKAGCGFVYDASKPETIVDAIMAMAKDSSLLVRQKESSREYARTIFNWQVQSQPLREVLLAWAQECVVAGDTRAEV